MKVLAVLVFLVLATIFVPIIAMWCVDTLFGTNIPVNIKTWFAALVLLALTGGGAKASVSKN